MKSNYTTLGQFIRQVSHKNKDLALEKLLGVSIAKKFIDSIANTVGTDFSKYKIVKEKQFAYGPVTSRNGDKISVALLEVEECIISSSYTVFEVIDHSLLLPEYLMMWFSRPEFDRYARFKSHGSVREIFSWEDMCGVELPVPSIEKQKAIVEAYRVVTDRIALKEKINEKLEDMARNIFKEFYRALSGETTILDSLAYFGNGRTRPSTKGGFPVYGGNGIITYTCETNRENVVVIGRVGIYCGNIFLETGKCWVSDNAIWSKSKLLEDEYFNYLLLDYLQVNQYIIGTGQPLLTQEIIKNITVKVVEIEEARLINQQTKPLFVDVRNNLSELRKLKSLQQLLLSQISKI